MASNTQVSTPTKFSMQQVFYILLLNPSDRSIIAYLNNVKTTGLENQATMVYPTGGRGNVKIGSGYAHSIAASFNVTSATFDTELMALQNGTERELGIMDITAYDTILPTETGAYFTKYVAEGLDGVQISHVYELDSNGSYSSVYEQVDGTPSTGQFAYDTTTKEITFSEVDLATMNKATLACAYTRKTDENSQRITFSGDAIPAKCLIAAYGVTNNVCDEGAYPCVLEGTVVIDMNSSFDLSADGEAASQALNMEFVRACGVEELYTFTVYTEDVPA